MKRETVFKRCGWCLFAILFSIAAADGVLAQSSRETPSPTEAAQLADYERVLLFRDPEAAAVPSYSFGAFSRLFEFELTPASPFLPGAETVWIAADGRGYSQQDSGWSYWSGRLKDEPGSAVRLRTRGSAVEGMIRDHQQIYLLQPVSPESTGEGVAEAIIYRLNDLRDFWNAYGCGVEADGWTGLSPRSAGPGAAADQASKQGGVMREAEVRLLIDSYYFQRYGFSAADQVHQLIHALNGLFEAEMGVTFRVTETEVATSPSQDSVSATTDARLLLDDLGRAQVLAGADMAHLFTGRELNGNTLGISWIGAACEPAHAVSLTQDLPTAPLRFVALAHELAHVLGARHDGRGYCGQIPTGWIMWPVLSPSATTFSECSRELVGLNLPRFSCVSTLSPALLPAPQPATASVIKPIHLRWRPVEGAEAYVVEVFDERRGETLYSETVSGTDVMPNVEFQAGGHYRWRVAGVTSAGLGERSPWSRFTVSTWVTR